MSYTTHINTRGDTYSFSSEEIRFLLSALRFVFEARQSDAKQFAELMQSEVDASGGDFDVHVAAKEIYDALCTVGVFPVSGRHMLTALLLRKHKSSLPETHESSMHAALIDSLYEILGYGWQICIQREVNYESPNDTFGQDSDEALCSPAEREAPTLTEKQRKFRQFIADVNSILRVAAMDENPCFVAMYKDLIPTFSVQEHKKRVIVQVDRSNILYSSVPLTRSCITVKKARLHVREVLSVFASLLMPSEHTNDAIKFSQVTDERLAHQKYVDKLHAGFMQARSLSFKKG